jgi:hypothetical protein
MHTKIWLDAAKKALDAWKTYKAFCAMLGRMSKKKNSRGKSIAMKGLNYWRNMFYDYCLIEQILRVA